MKIDIQLTTEQSYFPTWNVHNLVYRYSRDGIWHGHVTSTYSNHPYVTMYSGACANWNKLIHLNVRTVVRLGRINKL